MTLAETRRILRQIKEVLHLCSERKLIGTSGHLCSECSNEILALTNKALAKPKREKTP